MKLRQKKVSRTGPFPDSPNFNPWLIAMHSMSWVSPHAERAGFTTNQLHYARRHFDAFRDVGELFLANTGFHTQRVEWMASAPEYFSSYLGPMTALSGSESIDAQGSIDLPEPRWLDMALSSVIKVRHSVRRFSGDTMHLEDLATICHAAAGITHTTTATPIDEGPSYELQCRSVPSAGGLYGIDCYCFALRIQRLSSAVYKYAPYYHTLEKLHPEVSMERMLGCFAGAEATGLDPSKLAAVILFVGNPQKVVRKYGTRGVQYFLLEGGMMAFSANLAATALGYGTLDYQSFLDDEIRAVLGISERPQHVLHTLLLGWSAESGGKRSM